MPGILSFRGIFTRRKEGLIRCNVVQIGISTIGNIGKVALAVPKVKEKDTVTIDLLGRDIGRFKMDCGHSTVLLLNDTSRIQQLHTLAIQFQYELIGREIATG